jgi:hypothetical protein
MRVRRGKPATSGADTTELAGELIATPMPDETEEIGGVAPQTFAAGREEPSR